MRNNVQGSSGSLLAATFRALLLALIGCTFANGENVCYYSSSTCTGQATCVEAVPNSGQCGSAAFGSYGMLNENGSGYMADIYSDRSCSKHLVSLQLYKNKCVPVMLPAIGNIYVQVHANGTGPSSQSGGPSGQSAAVAASSSNQNRDTMAAFMYIGYSLCALVLITSIVV